MYISSSHRSNHSKDLSSSSKRIILPIEVKKSHISNKCSYLTIQKDSARYVAKKRIQRKQESSSTINLYYENERKFRKAIIKFDLAHNSYSAYKNNPKEEDSTFSKEFEGSRNRKKKKLFRSASKQNKIILKLPSMIEVHLKEGDEGSVESTPKRRKKKGRYRKDRVQKEEIKVEESSGQEHIVLPKMLRQKPIFNQIKGRKINRNRDAAKNNAIEQLRKSKEMHSINLIDDNFIKHSDTKEEHKTLEAKKDSLVSIHKDIKQVAK